MDFFIDFHIKSLFATEFLFFRKEKFERSSLSLKGSAKANGKSQTRDTENRIISAVLESITPARLQSSLDDPHPRRRPPVGAQDI